ncbi:MAG TPA: peptidyl-alpha-hydroxyglycine alpha-amidating lyase family protein [Hanamia sp.]|nr:peptidyl-alpha-hydroxyglycine alpha-amidating lyase family protein [Hanamia sp.]
MRFRLLNTILIFAILILCCYIFQNKKIGSGYDTTIKYELVKDWLKLPDGIIFGNPTGIAVDTNQNIIVFQRADRKWSLLGSMPDKPIHDKTVLIINKDNGKLVNSWGDDLFIMPHGLKVDNENNIWLTDVGLNQVFKFSHDGKLLMKLGVAKVSGNDSLHFNKPTDIAIAKDGSFYVSDGYGNSRIIKFSTTGKYLFEWGTKGNNEGEFNIPHGISLDSSGNVYVADRENNRIQEFDPNGKFIKQFTDNTFGAICAVAFDKTQSKLFAVDDFTFLKIKHRGSDVFIFDKTGKVQTRFGRSGSYQGNTSWYHDLTVDKDENIYIGDILGNTIQKFRKVSNH